MAQPGAPRPLTSNCLASLKGVLVFHAFVKKTQAMRGDIQCGKLFEIGISIRDRVHRLAVR
jgi:hypothetical protein